jgi:hypothetical protein
MKNSLTRVWREFRHIAIAFAAVAAFCVPALFAVTPLPADAAISMATQTRTDRCTALVTRIGTGGILQVRSGARPASANAAATGTLLATLTWTGVNMGSCTSGVFTMATGSATQTAASHTSGTPGHFRILQSNGTTVVMDIDVCGTAPCWTFTGTVTTGQAITFPTAPTITEGSL